MTGPEVAGCHGKLLAVAYRLIKKELAMYLSPQETAVRVILMYVPALMVSLFLLRRWRRERPSFWLYAAIGCGLVGPSCFAVFLGMFFSGLLATNPWLDPFVDVLEFVWSVAAPGGFVIATLGGHGTRTRNPIRGN